MPSIFWLRYHAPRLLAGRIKGFEAVGAIIEESLHLVDELGEHVAVIIELHIEPAKLVVMALEAFLKRAGFQARVTAPVGR